MRGSFFRNSICCRAMIVNRFRSRTFMSVRWGLIHVLEYLTGLIRACRHRMTRMFIGSLCALMGCKQNKQNKQLNSHDCSPGVTDTTRIMPACM